MRPTRACICRHPDGHETHAAISCEGSPDQDQQAAAFDAAHPVGDPNHKRVERLPERKAKGDPTWGGNGL